MIIHKDSNHEVMVGTILTGNKRLMKKVIANICSYCILVEAGTFSHTSKLLRIFINTGKRTGVSELYGCVYKKN